MIDLQHRRRLLSGFGWRFLHHRLDPQCGWRVDFKLRAELRQQI